ncbi:flavodoxin I [Bacillus mesophilus]|uniref:Flavodoxin n=1 Tax=Bacillus mesophilus TaxID=1808955 RepID=A0A6M0Q962_9BACI|nr:flavodoxin domain-containing protein [Bacillus mesophilus]MBM7661860.1 flavodoxin I [Bacillus mesophilus]NEY72777.1 flavodoxin [Bacillus mesophilus]
MKKVCIVFRSLTNNTEEIARLLSNHLSKYCEVDMFNMDGLDPSTLLQYDGILIGAFTWGNGTLHYDCHVFYKKLNRIDLRNKVVGCFGSGDYTFTNFCAAVDIFQEKVRERGGIVVLEGLKIHLAPETDECFKKCLLFSRAFVTLIGEKCESHSHKEVFLA